MGYWTAPCPKCGAALQGPTDNDIAALQRVGLRGMCAPTYTVRCGGQGCSGERVFPLWRSEDEKMGDGWTYVGAPPQLSPGS